MRIITAAFLLIGLLVFSRYYRRFPKTVKGVVARILAVIIIFGWIYLVLRVR